MRTTLTLEPDVALNLKRKMADQKLTLKDAVNQALRIGLAAKDAPTRVPFKVIPFDLGLPPGIDQDKLGQWDDRLEDERIARKLGVLVIIPDVNVLIHAYNSGSLHHRAARAWWEETLTLPRPVGLPWVSILGFVRITTRAAAAKNPLYPGEAIRLVRAWLEVPGVQILTPGEFHAEIFFRLIEQAGTAGDLTTDAHLAALAIEYQAEVASTDTDFARFPGLRWFNPVAL